jgi:hypothetical protein
VPAGEVTADEVGRALAPFGLIVRGGFAFGAGEVAPPGPSGSPARSVLLVGSAGDAFWPPFQTWLGGQDAGIDDPLDTWSRVVLGEVAEKVGARVLMPNDRPYAPFQQWAMRAERLKPSPLGILIHPEYGLWHAWRGALLFDRDIVIEKEIQGGEPLNHLCDACVGKPCMNACPVDAFKGGGFAYETCLTHIGSGAGLACMQSGCLARNACPHLRFRYASEVQAFFMEAFRKSGADRMQGTEPGSSR